jgi:RND family efflux transporter MFP subunit
VLDPEEQDRHLTSARRGVELAATSVVRADADIERARVTREAAERDKKRAESLFASGVLSEAERDSAVERADRSAAELSAALAARRHSTTAVSVARATADVEAERTDETTITSPVDGIVVRRVREPGDVVSAGAPVLVVASTRKVWARTWIDETVIHELREGQAARVVLRGDPSHPLAARVDRVAVEGDRQTHEVLVDLELLEHPPRLVFGQRADGFIALEVVPSSIRIPQGACDVARGRCPVERDGKVAYVDVKLGLQGNEWVEVQSGLASGDVVLLPEPSSGAPPAGRRVERRTP